MARLPCWGRIGMLLGTHWGRIGEVLETHWGRIGDALGLPNFSSPARRNSAFLQLSFSPFIELQYLSLLLSGIYRKICTLNIALQYFLFECDI